MHFQLQKSFDHLAETFTLEKIIELGLDAYAEQISEISSAASKELAIEQVNEELEIFNLLLNLFIQFRRWQKLNRFGMKSF